MSASTWGVPIAPGTCEDTRPTCGSRWRGLVPGCKCARECSATRTTGHSLRRKRRAWTSLSRPTWCHSRCGENVTLPWSPPQTQTSSPRSRKSGSARTSRSRSRPGKATVVDAVSGCRCLARICGAIGYGAMTTNECVMTLTTGRAGRSSAHRAIGARGEPLPGGTADALTASARSAGGTRRSDGRIPRDAPVAGSASSPARSRSRLR